MKAGQSSQLFSILLLALILVGAIVFVLPMRDTIASLSTQKDTLTQELLTLDTQYQALSALSEDVSQSETTKLKLLAAVPVGYDQDALILELTGLASESGFELNAIGFSLGQDPVYGKTISVATNVKGSFSELVDFLQKLENADRLFRVKSLSLQRLSATEVSFNIAIEAYYQ